MERGHMQNTERTQPELLRVEDVMELYHVTRLTVYNWIKAGKLEGQKAGRRWLFTREAVEGMLKG